MTSNGRPTPKSLALVALTDALEEAARPTPRPLVLSALLRECLGKVEAIDELVRPRRAKKESPT